MAAVDGADAVGVRCTAGRHSTCPTVWVLPHRGHWVLTHGVQVHCWEAQHLPAMDSMALEGKACDPFCTIRFGGSGRVKTKAIKKTQNPVSRDMA